MVTVSRLYGEMAMSLCGGLTDCETPIPDELFTEHMVTYSKFIERPHEVMQDPKLVIRISGK